MTKAYSKYYDVSFWIGHEYGKCLVCGTKGCASDIWNEIKEGAPKFCPACGRRIFFLTGDEADIKCIYVKLKEEDCDG